MPSPASSDAVLRPDLGMALEEYDATAEEAGYIAQRVLPVFESQLQSHGFARIPIKALLQNPEVDRAPTAAYNRGNWEYEKDSFATSGKGWEEPVDDEEAAILANYFDAEYYAAVRARGFVQRAAEKRAADLLFDSSTFNTTAVSIEWSTLATATPIDDVEAAVIRVWEASGLWPNALIINRLVFRNLRNCAQILERINSAGAGDRTLAKDVTTAQLANVFDLEQVIVAGAPQNTANEAQDVEISPIWSSEYAMVGRVARTGDLREPCVGRTFHWAGTGSKIGCAIETYYETARESTIVRAKHHVQEKLLHTPAAELLENITG